MTTATSHDALAWEDARAALSRCASVQAWLAITAGNAEEKAAAAAALIFLKDAGDDLPARYLLVSVLPSPPIRQAGDLVQRVFNIEVQAITAPTDGDEPQDDFVKGHNLGEVGVEWMDQHEDGLLDFELVEVPVCSDPQRDDESGDRDGDIIQLITAQLQSWGE